MLLEENYLTSFLFYLKKKILMLMPKIIKEFSLFLFNATPMKIAMDNNNKTFVDYLLKDPRLNDDSKKVSI